MDQKEIWNFFQNDDQMSDIFEGARPRYEFLAKQINSGMSVLNIGVGRGGLEGILINRGIKVSCLDPNEDSINGLRKQYALGDRAQVGFSQCIPFLDGQFDVVIMSEVLEHLADDILILTLTEVRRVLKADGLFIGTVPADERLKANCVACPHCGQTFHRWGHVQSFSLTRLQELLLANRFTVKCKTMAFPDWGRSGITSFFKSVVRYLLGRAGLPIAQPNIFFKAKRMPVGQVKSVQKKVRIDSVKI